MNTNDEAQNISGSFDSGESLHQHKRQRLNCSPFSSNSDSSMPFLHDSRHTSNTSYCSDQESTSATPDLEYDCRANAGSTWQFFKHTPTHAAPSTSEKRRKGIKRKRNATGTNGRKYIPNELKGLYTELAKYKSSFTDRNGKVQPNWFTEFVKANKGITADYMDIVEEHLKCPWECDACTDSDDEGLDFGLHWSQATDMEDCNSMDSLAVQVGSPRDVEWCT
mmetsp:Transcript_9542/g.10553  ORF Transcript_9542/g.10553 Transcript_9542/m.10553 type:complete len:222 (+) Transcript_9542:115-780(+)